MGKRKYPKVKGYWVYSIKVPSNNKYYIGISRYKECWQRWQKANYKGTALEPYLSEWDSMIKTVLVDNLTTKKESLIYEDNIIQALQMNNLCINSYRSGMITSNENVYQKDYQREYRENNREQYNEYHKQKQRQYRLKKKLERKQHTVVD